MKDAFDKIQAENELKEATLSRIFDDKSESKAENHKSGFFSNLRIKRISTVMACVIPLFVIGLFSYNTFTSYYTESAYVDLDINPSIELSVNKYNRIINASAYNGEGDDLLADLDIKNEKIESALPEIIHATAQEGQLQKEGLVSVTVQANSQKEKELLALIEEIVDETLADYEGTETDIFAVDSQVKNTSHNMDLTPAKYLAICKLQEVDPTATVDECRHNSIGGIKKRTKEHEEKHKKDGSGSGKHSSGGNNESGGGSGSASGSGSGSGQNSSGHNSSGNNGSGSSSKSSNHSGGSGSGSSSSGSGSGSSGGSTHHDENESHDSKH